MSALDDLLATPRPARRRQPPEGAMDKIMAAKRAGWSIAKITEAACEDYGPTGHETIARWISDHEAQ